MNEDIKSKIKQRLQNSEMNLENILKLLFQDEELKSRYTNDIRRSTIIWQVANEILLESNIDDLCKILAIWDIKLFWEHEKIWNLLISESLKNISPTNLTWYDLTSQWSFSLRSVLFDYMQRIYDFENINKNVENEIIPTYGWTDWFVLILDSLRTLFTWNDLKLYCPEASFMANVKIAEDILWEENIIPINKPNTSNFFLTKNEIENIKDEWIQVFYITTVWNPTWSKLELDNYKEVLLEISKRKNSYIILDNVYVWLLKDNSRNELFKDIFNNSELLNKIIFTESLSKTLWMTWVRIWWVWTLNDFISQELKRKVILKKAWFSKILNEFTINLLSKTDEVEEFWQSVYDFWSSQRLWFIKLVKEKYLHFFDLENSPPILDREGIYCFLKVRQWYTKEEIFASTWMIGVWIELSDWLYIRYAFWNVNYF